MFIILEFQTTDGKTSVLTPIKKPTLNEAESVYHQILASAAISSVEHHTAMVIDDEGVVFDNKCYHHGQEEDEPS